MRPRKSNRNLKKVNTPLELVEKKEEATPEIDNWLPKVLAVEGPQQNCWLVDSAADVHVCNNQSLITKYCAHTTRIGRSTSHGISPGREKIRRILALKDGSEGLILNPSNVFYLLNSPYNLLSLGLLNNSGIYYDNKNETLYKIYTRQLFVQAQR